VGDHLWKADLQQVVTGFDSKIGEAYQSEFALVFDNNAPKENLLRTSLNESNVSKAIDGRMSSSGKPLEERLMDLIERHLRKPRHPLAQVISSFQ